MNPNLIVYIQDIFVPSRTKLNMYMSMVNSQNDLKFLTLVDSIRGKGAELPKGGQNHAQEGKNRSGGKFSRASLAQAKYFFPPDQF